ncbi:MAG: virulence factor [Ilumatobacteraceae bacterium]
MTRTGNSVVVILWRDIPAQVNAQVGRERHQIMLSAKFQRAIDRAKRKAHIYTADEDVAQWRRLSIVFDGDVKESAQREADRVELEFTRRRLGMLAFAGGFENDVQEHATASKELAALEELL